MIKLNSPRCLLASIVTALLLSQPAAAIFIDDGYIGADDNGYNDVIGSNLFNIEHMNASLSGTTLSVSIKTLFAGEADMLHFAGYTGTTTGQNQGIGYGDLFLSSKWTPFGASSGGYIGDNRDNGTTWSYGFSLGDNLSLDNRWKDAGSGTLYSLNSADNSDIVVSDAFFDPNLNVTFRNGQEVAVDTSKNVTSVSTGSWSSDVVNDLITFEIELAGTTLLDGPEIALHWGFTCANDVIEGAIDVPEPKVYLLLSMGLLGMLVLRRKRFKA